MSIGYYLSELSLKSVYVIFSLSGSSKLSVFFILWNNNNFSYMKMLKPQKDF